MVSVSMECHVFSKTNLVTRSGKAGDHYKCEVCGLEGDREGLDPYIRVKADRKCDGPPQRELPEQVRVIRYEGGHALKDGEIYDVVPCPAAYYPKYKNDVWVYSEMHGEPLRLWPREYEAMPVVKAAQLPMF